MAASGRNLPPRRSGANWPLLTQSGHSSVFFRIDNFASWRKLNSAIKANLAKAIDAKPRVLASSATFVCHEGPQDRRAANHQEVEPHWDLQLMDKKLAILASAIFLASSLAACGGGGGSSGSGSDAGGGTAPTISALSFSPSVAYVGADGGELIVIDGPDHRRHHHTD